MIARSKAYASVRRPNLRGALIGVVAGLVGALPLPASAQQIVRHPSELVYPELSFDPPAAADHRHELSNGVAVFVVEDHDLPLINISLLVRGGVYTAAAMATPGAATLAGSQIHNGGTASKSPSELDEDLDFLAAQMFTSLGSTQGSAGMNCLTKDLDACLELFFEMVRNPGYDQERLELAKSQTVQQMQRRNDATTSIEGREWSRLIYGTEHFSTKAVNQAELEAISREDLLALHAQTFHPGNFVVAVSGDVAAEQILPKLEAAMADWPAGESPGQVPGPTSELQPGLYLVHKEDVNQGRISLGHRTITRDNPDRYALQIMNSVLGGGGFTSRIMSRVRSDEGLAYSAGSRYGVGTHYEGAFRAAFQSRSETVARATALVLEEVERIRTEPVTDEELANAKASFIDTFSRSFASVGQVAGLFANDELTGRDTEYLVHYRDRLRAVSAADVMRVAHEYLHPEALVILAVGNVDDTLAGDPENPEYSLEALAPDGSVTRVPLPDPMTMEYPEQ